MNKFDIQELTHLHVDVLNQEVNFHLVPSDIRCGLKSNIPYCCIAFWCTIWRSLYFFINFALVKRFMRWYPSATICEYNYIPCPFCILFRRVRKLYVCSENDVSCCCFNKQPVVLLEEERLSQ